MNSPRFPNMMHLLRLPLTRHLLFVCLLTGVVAGPTVSTAAEADTEANADGEADEAGSISVANVEHEGPVDFEREILPILRRNCLACHNEGEAEASLILETPATIRNGGDSGDAVTPGNGNESLLLSVASHRSDPVMPPEGNKVEAKNLTPAELGLLKLWIDQGAKGDVGRGGEVKLTPPPATLRPVFAVAVLPHGDYVAAGRANRVNIYHVPTQQLIADLSDPALASASPNSPAAAHVDLVHSLAASPDGKTLASGGYRTVKFWRKGPPRMVRESTILKPLGDATGDATGDASSSKSEKADTAVALSQDGRWSAVAGRNDTIHVYDSRRGTISQTMAGHEGRVGLLDFSPDGTRLLSYGADQIVKLWDVAKGQELARFIVADEVSALSLLSNVGDVSNAGDVATAGCNKTVSVWNADSGKMLFKTDVDTPVAHLAASPDGKTLVAIGDNGTAQLIDAATGTSLTTLHMNVFQERAASDARRAMAVSERVLTWAQYDRNEIVKTVKRAEQKVKNLGTELQDLIKKGKTSTDAEYQKVVTSLAFRATDLKDLSSLVVDAEKLIQQRREEVDAAKAALKTAEELAAAPAARLRKATFSSDGKRLAAIDTDGHIRTFTAASGLPIDVITASKNDSIGAIAYPTDGRLLTLTAAGKLQTWQPGQWSHHRTIGAINTPETLIDRVTALAFSPNGKLLATGSGETSRSGELKIWDVATGELVRTIDGAHSDTVLGIEFSNDGVYLASCGSDRNMRVFDVATGERVQSFEYHTSHVLSVSWRADGRLLATAGADNVVRAWNFKTGNEHKVIKQFDDKEVTGIQFLGNSGDFVVSAANNTVSRWDYNGRGGKRYDGVKSFMYAIGACADGSTIAAGGHDGTVHVWSRDGKQLATFE